MRINLLKTYNDMIKSSQTTQKDVDTLHNSVCMDYFLRPDLKIYQRAGRRYDGELIPGLCIYPDEKCICEMLNNLQNSLDEEILESSETPPAKMITYLLGHVYECVTNYFGTTQSHDNADKVFYEDTNSGERLAKLSDFKGKDCAECIERALAAHIVMCVLAEDPAIKDKGIFQCISFMHFTWIKCNVAQPSSASGGHVICGLISQDENKTVYLFDPSSYGKIKYDAKEWDVYAIYELTREEAKTLFEGDAVEPQLIYTKNIEGVEQISHRAYSKRPNEFKKLMERYKSNDFSR